MSNVVPAFTKMSNSLTARPETEAEYQMICTLLEKNPRYEIPRHLREQVVGSCAKVLAYPNGNCDSKLDKLKLIAGKLLLECDKRNLDIVKMSIPKHVVHHNVEEFTDEQLQSELQRLIDEKQLVPSMTQGVIDAEIVQ